MILRIILCIALLFAVEAHARECLSKNEIKKAVEQSFYSLYRWQSYWYGYYYDIDLEPRIRRNGRMIVDFHKEDFLRGFCDQKRNNNLLIQFAAYLKGVDLIYVGKIRNGKADM